MNKDDFEAMLAWLDPHSEQRAAERYEEIRRRIIQILARRGCPDPEDLADEAINRVCKKVKKIAPTYKGDPALYFYAVAIKVCLEAFKKPKKHVPIMPAPNVPEDVEARHRCLDHCLQQLSPENRELIRGYYEGEKGAKIKRRQRLADLLGIDMQTLRVRAHRIRLILRKCISECLERAAAG